MASSSTSSSDSTSGRDAEVADEMATAESLAPADRTRGIWSFVVRFGLFSLLVLLLLELVFRTVIPAAEYPIRIDDPVYGIERYSTEYATSGTRVDGRFGDYQADWSINNAGWVANIDYLPPAERERPVVAIIGNSYVQGMLIEWPDHFAHLLDENLTDFDVYAFGIDGAGTADYPALAAYVEAEFEPDIVVVLATVSDLETSFGRFGGKAPKISETDDGLVLVPAKPARSSTVSTVQRRALRASAVLRYLRFNAGLNLGGGAQVITANPDNIADRVAENRDYIDAGYDIILEAITAATDDARVIVMLDGDRTTAGTPESMPLALAEPISEAAARAGVEFLDLHQSFDAAARAGKGPFDFDFDYHWNQTGNVVVADTLTELIGG